MMYKITLPLSLLIILLLSTLLTPVPVVAQDNEPTDDEVNAIAKQLYCPVCENIPLDTCQMQACRQWRDTIREKLTAGWSEEQIKQYFVEQYGVRVLATPPAKGINLLFYILPPVALLVGTVILLRAFRNWRQATVQSEQVQPVQTEDPYIARLEEELRRRER